MITVTISNNITRVRRVMDPETTLRQALEAEEIDYSVGTVALDGSSLPAGSLDNTFASYGIDDKCFLTVAVKADNAAGVSVIGNTAVIKADFKLEDLKKIQASRPKKLSIFEDDVEVFKIGAGKGNGHIGSAGWSFGEAVTADGNAMITMTVPESVSGSEAIKKWVAGKVGTGIINLKKIEERFADAIAEINAENAAVESCITVL